MTSLKAFSHQRQAKPFNTLRSKADLFERRIIVMQFLAKKPFLDKKPFLAKNPLQIWQNYFWPKSIFCWTVISVKKPLLAEKPFLAKKVKSVQFWFIAISGLKAISCQIAIAGWKTISGQKGIFVWKGILADKAFLAEKIFLVEKPFLTKKSG